MEIECFEVPLKPDAIKLVREWAARLNNEMSEVKKLLKSEGILLESVFLREASDGASLIYYLRGHDLKKAREISKASQHPLDVYHQQIMKQVAVGSQKLECLLDASSD
jgi:hypothetical protein